MTRLRWKTLTGKRGLYHAAVTRLAPGMRTFLHSQDFWEMFLVLEGAGWHLRNHHKIPLQPGHLVVVSPTDTHAFSTGATQTLTFVNVAVSARWWKGFHDVVEAPPGWERSNRPSGHFLLPSAAAESLRLLLFQLMEPGVEKNSTLLLAWVQALSAAIKPEKNPTTVPPWLEQLHRDMHRPDLISENTAFWQKRSARSPEHLARSCRRYYGAPLNELINRARIERAKFLLQTSDIKVTTAAFESGYNNLAHFYRVFQRLTGRTPRDWRNAAARHAVPA